jgi:hypothetical protein
MKAFLVKANALVDRRLTRDADNAAGRMGLFRIVYSVYFLLYLSVQWSLESAAWPGLRETVLLVHWIPTPSLILQAATVECLLVGSLVLLAVGYRTTATTAVVLVLGLLFEGWRYEADAHKSAVFLVFYIPFFMLLCGGWGDTYSLDSQIRQRTNLPRTDPACSDGLYMTPAHVSLVILSVMFFLSAAAKMIGAGTWWSYPEFMADAVLYLNVLAATWREPCNVLAPFISQTPWASQSMKIGALLFEGFFWLSLLHKRLFGVVMSVALMFHAVNSTWLTVTFSGIMIAYLIHVDWHRLWITVRPDGLPRVPASVAGRCVGATWNTSFGLRPIFNLGGFLDQRTIWSLAWPVVPVLLVRSSWALATDVLGTLRMKS